MANVRTLIDAFNRGGIVMALHFLDPEAASPPTKE
jgi:hypothetical protein